MNPAQATDASVFEMKCVPIDLPSVTVSGWHVLDFHIQQQIKSNWCWAAVAASVAHFYRPSSAVTQYDIANGELRRDDCGQGDRCNVYGHLMSSLFRVGHFEKWAALQPANSDRIHEEINRRRPLCARIAWVGGGAHLVAIAGYADEPTPDLDDSCHDPYHDRYIGGLAIADPWWGLSDIDGEDFPRRYAKYGSWTDSYYTTA